MHVFIVPLFFYFIGFIGDVHVICAILFILLVFPFIRTFNTITHSYILKHSESPLYVASCAGFRSKPKRYGKKVWRSGRVSECEFGIVGSPPGAALYEILQLCRRSSTFLKLQSIGEVRW